MIEFSYFIYLWKKARIKVHDFQNEVHNFKKITRKGLPFSKLGPEFTKKSRIKVHDFQMRSRILKKSRVKVHDPQNEVQNFESSQVKVHDFQNDVQF